MVDYEYILYHTLHSLVKLRKVRKCPATQGRWAAESLTRLKDYGTVGTPLVSGGQFVQGGTGGK
jgi:hypothetical protein